MVASTTTPERVDLKYWHVLFANPYGQDRAIEVQADTLAECQALADLWLIRSGWPFRGDVLIYSITKHQRVAGGEDYEWRGLPF